DRVLRGPILDQLRKDVPRQRLDRREIAEERGHADQEVLVQALNLGGMIFEVACVLLDPLDVDERHAPPDAAQERRPLVGAEVVATDFPEEEKGLRERVLFADRPKRTVPPAAGGGLQERKADDEP